MKKNKLILVGFCILLPLFLILFSYKTILFFTDLAQDQQQTVNFLQNKDKLRLNYTAGEISHLVDVKEVFKIGDYLFYFLLLVLTLTLTYYRKDKKQLKKLFLYGGIVTVSFLALLLIFSLVAFDTSFTLFHQLFFPQGNWTFAADSLLIQTFPLEFFIGISRNIFLLSLFLGIGFILGCYLFFRGK